MKTAIAVLLLLVCLPTWAQTQTRQKPTCAILTFDARAGVSTLESESLSDRFAAEFERLGRFTIVARSKTREVLEEQKFQGSDSCAASECAIEAGRLLGVRCMVYGTITRLGSLFSVNSFIVDVETGANIRNATTDLRVDIEEMLTSGMRQNAMALLGMKPAPTVPAAALPAEADRKPTLAPVDFRTPVYITNTTRLKTASPGMPLHPQYKEFFFGPRIGASMLSGLVGLEMQYRHLAIMAGMGPGSGYAIIGAKFYFSSNGNTWYLGGGGGGISKGYDDKSDTLFGGLVGYRWQSPAGWSMNVGLGIGGFRENLENDLKEETQIMPMVDLAVGYSF